MTSTTYHGSASAKDSFDTGNNGENTPIAIRKASSLRLYRCRRHNAHGNESTEQGNHLCTDYLSGNCSARILEHEGNEECHCCCCSANFFSLDSLIDILPAESCTPDGCANYAQCKALDSKKRIPVCKSNMLLAVFVPSSLTQGLIRTVSQYNKAACDEMKHNGRKDDFRGEENPNQRLNDAEVELRKSIHPCLCPTGTRQTIHYDGANSSEEHDKIHEQQQNVGGCHIPPTSYPPLFVCGILTSNDVSNCTNFPADVVLLAPKNMSPTTSFAYHARNRFLCRDDVISHYSNILNHETASYAQWSVIKAFPVSTVSIFPATPGVANGKTSTSTNSRASDIAALPCCPVCLNLIEPTHLGLPELKPHHKCSRCCSYSDALHDVNDYSKENPCVNEIKFFPWPSPAECAACQQRMISMDINASSPRRSSSTKSPLPLSRVSPRIIVETDNQDYTMQSLNSHPLTCHQCAMSTTLWVCLTCGVVGCGRYTLKHAAQHYTLEGHPYSLELATGRIWDYEKGSFIHRKDLVECPVLSMKWGIAVASCEGTSSPSLLAASSLSGISFQGEQSHPFSENGNHHGWREEGPLNGVICNSYDDIEYLMSSSHNNRNQHSSSVSLKLSAQPKKSIMISQEYEALLQSALEDQSQHYEGEISRLRADLASSCLQGTQTSNRDSHEIHGLEKDKERLKQDVERLSCLLLEAQTKEAKHRSMSQRLFREQSIAKDLLEKIHKETIAEHQSGKQRMQDLEMQIADLTANLCMMSQFARSEELNQAQIFGTTGREKLSKQRGKKPRRGRKKFY